MAAVLIDALARNVMGWHQEALIKDGLVYWHDENGNRKAFAGYLEEDGTLDSSPDCWYPLTPDHYEDWLEVEAEIECRGLKESYVEELERLLDIGYTYTSTESIWKLLRAPLELKAKAALKAVGVEVE
jgi:hypothetical protein